MSKKVLSTIFLILAVGMVLFFTIQSAEGTTALSEAVRKWLGDHGIITASHALRSNAHIPEYFILGLAVLAFGKSHGWTIGRCMPICFLIGLADEGVKIWIPGREFDMIDLLRDWIGVFAAFASVTLICRLLKKDVPYNGKNT